MVVLTVIALLLSVVVPDYVGRMKRAEEAVLQENLAVMRDALDKHYADAGKYPSTLEELVAKRYLRAIPSDPCTQSAATCVPLDPVLAVERTSQGSPSAAGGVPMASWMFCGGAKSSPIFGARTARW